MKRIFFYLILLFNLIANAQTAKVSEIIFENKHTYFDGQKLILVDFWATWCAPCVSATEQLEILQKHNTDKIYIISMSDEHASKIKPYLQKKPIQLMVCSDSDGYTFNKYNVKTRPYAVLFNLKGAVLWQGHPADLTQQKLDYFYNLEKNTANIKSISKFLDIEAYQEINENKLQPNQDIVIIETTATQEGLQETEQEVSFEGKLSDLLVNINILEEQDIELSADADLSFKMICTKDYWKNHKTAILEQVFNYFNLRKTEKTINENAFEIVVENPKMLWDSNQFDWGDAPTKYLIGTDRIQADNLSIKSICSLLSKTNEQKYIYNGKNETLYDWDFQYLHPNLMEEEFESSFGIVFKPKKIVTKITLISK